MFKRARSLAAKRGWATRRRNQRARSLAAKRGWITRRKHENIRQQEKQGRPQLVEREHEIITHLLHGKIKTRERGRSGTFTRDFLVPAQRGTTKRGLLKIAKDTITERLDPIQRAILYSSSATFDVSEGKPTHARKATLR